MQGTIAVLDKNFGPACKLALLGICWKIAPIDYDFVFEIFAASQVSLTSLVTTFDNLRHGCAKASPSAIEEDDEIVGLVSLVDIDSWGRAVNAFGFGIGVMDYFLERLLCGEYGCE